MDDEQKTSEQTNCKGQLALTVRGERRLRRIAARLAWAREHRDWSVEFWKRVAGSNESRFRLLNADGRLRIWRQAHGAIDPACQSLLATGWLDEHSSDFYIINWSPRSADLNRIELLWDVLEQYVKGRHTSPTNLTELWTALANIWLVTPVERFHKLVESMPRCGTGIIRVRGGPIRD
ncbi:transposable element Tc1 transposase [Trichonephila clavipes]|nr:transposable element Tc1 transposase [Trichonephila clavipes]